MRALTFLSVLSQIRILRNDPPTPPHLRTDPTISKSQTKVELTDRPNPATEFFRCPHREGSSSFCKYEYTTPLETLIQI